MNALMYMCAAYLMMSFVKLYTNGVSDAEYTNVLLMILMVCFGLVNILRIPYNNTVYIRGLFKETYLQPVICAAISLFLMVVLTAVDYTYTLIGSIFFFLTNTLYQHFKLPRLFPGFNNKRFWNHLAVIVCGVGLALIAHFIYPIEPANFFGWTIDACITGILSLLVLSGLVFLLDRKSLKLTINYFASRKRNK